MQDAELSALLSGPDLALALECFPELSSELGLVVPRCCSSLSRTAEEGSSCATSTKAACPASPSVMPLHSYLSRACSPPPVSPHPALPHTASRPPPRWEADSAHEWASALLHVQPSLTGHAQSAPPTPERCACPSPFGQEVWATRVVVAPNGRAPLPPSPFGAPWVPLPNLPHQLSGLDGRTVTTGAGWQPGAKAREMMRGPRPRAS